MGTAHIGWEISFGLQPKTPELLIFLRLKGVNLENSLRSAFPAATVEKKHRIHGVRFCSLV